MYLINDKLSLVLDFEGKLSLIISSNVKEELKLIDLDRVEINFFTNEIDNLNSYLEDNFEIESDFNSQEFEAFEDEYSESTETYISFVTEMYKYEENLDKIDENLKESIRFFEENVQILIIKRKEKKEN